MILKAISRNPNALFLPKDLFPQIERGVIMESLTPKCGLQLDRMPRDRNLTDQARKGLFK